MRGRILLKGMLLLTCFVMFSSSTVFSQDTCEGNFDCDQDVDGTDAAVFKEDFGRNPFSNPCPISPCPVTCEGTLSPGGRWCDQENGTVKDITTGLVWLKDAGWCGLRPWDLPLGSASFDAHETASRIWANLVGPPDLDDGSVEGDWRLPTESELVGISTGTEFITSSQPYFFDNVQPFYYWSSTTYSSSSDLAWVVYLLNGGVYRYDKSTTLHVWPVRGDYFWPGRG